DVLFDDRLGKTSPGVKFKDAELIGVPTIVVVGKGFVDGVVEVKDRATGEREDVELADLLAKLRD
ncbi:MAG: His/Gly/Thr/Pro-type tRNA ligase C-terminal domain-containing protein, partial [Aeromicrobium sp.]